MSILTIIFVLLTGIVLYLVYQCWMKERLETANVGLDKFVEEVKFRNLYPRLKSGDLVFFVNSKVRMPLRGLHGSRLGHCGMIFASRERPDEKYMLHLKVQYLPYAPRVELHPLEYIHERARHPLAFRLLENPLTDEQYDTLERFVRRAASFNVIDPFSGRRLGKQEGVPVRHYMKPTKDGHTIVQHSALDNVFATPVCFLNHTTSLNLNSTQSYWCVDFLYDLMAMLDLTGAFGPAGSCPNASLFQCGFGNVNQRMQSGNSYIDKEYCVD